MQEKAMVVYTLQETAMTVYFPRRPLVWLVISL